MATVLTELGGFLVTAGAATAVGTDLFRHRFPRLPDECTVLARTGGSAPMVGLGDAGIQAEEPTVQVKTRASKGDNDEAEARCRLAYRALATLKTGETASCHVVKIHQPPAPIGEDTSGRPLWGFNVTVAKGLSA